MKLAGVVILYQPSLRVIDNIKTYLYGLDELFVLDNSERQRADVVEEILEFERTRYIWLEENKGIAYALNYALSLCGNGEFLLTMDQDSSFSSGDILRYRESIQNKKDEDIIAFSIQFTTINGVYPNIPTSQFVDCAITSGMIINAKLAREIGGFDENLFIDGVDNEFCYRAREKNYEIWMVHDIVLKHRIGAPAVYKFLWKHPVVGNHSPIRTYYMIRNSFYVDRRHKQGHMPSPLRILSEFIKSMLYERNRLRRIKAMVLGIYDGIFENMGKCHRKI